MDKTTARRLAEGPLISFPPGVPDAVVTGEPEDHDRCWVLTWTTRRAVESRSPRDAQPPGTGPIALDKQSGAASYLSSEPFRATL